MIVVTTPSPIITEPLISLLTFETLINEVKPLVSTLLITIMTREVEYY